jgi:hypothetical protein
MKRTAVSSSNLASVGYDADAKILEIEFLDRSIYQYFNVPVTVYNGLMGASSHGKHFHTHIEQGGYLYKRIT